MTQAEIIAALSAFIALPDVPEDAFEAMALKVFAYQFRNNEPYKRFCLQRGRTPLSVRRWRDIPAVPIPAFKDLTLSCSPPEQASHVFMTSGTTQGIRGRSYHPTLDVWRRSMLVNISARFMHCLLYTPRCV